MPPEEEPGDGELTESLRPLPGLDLSGGSGGGLIENEPPRAGLGQPGEGGAPFLGLGNPRYREVTRRYLAIGLLALVAVLAIGTGAALINHAVTIEVAKDFLLAAFGPVVALAGSALGFFFASRHDDDDR